MVKLIEQLSARKEITEEEGTSPATSEENSTNGQEDYLKVEPEDKVQQLVDGPSETKRQKVEPVEEPTATVPIQEPVVGEAIESPVLLVKGEGNGADCDTGNPGEEKSEETCESKNEHGQTEDKSAFDCEPDRLKSCADSSESVVTIQPNTESSDSVSESACQTSSSVGNDGQKTPPLQLNSEKSVESNSVGRSVPEDCSEARTVVNSPEKADPSTPVTESTAMDLPTNEPESSKESSVVLENSTNISTLEVVKPISIDTPPTEVDGCLKPQESTEVSVMSNVPEDEVDRCVVTNVSDPVESSESLNETPKSEASANCSVLQDPETETICHSEVKLDPLPPESLSVVRPVESSTDDSVSIEQFPLTSDSDNVTLDSSDVPAEETKQTVESVSVPVTEVILSAALEEEKSPKIEESHSEQITELEEKEESLNTTETAGNANVYESESEKTKPTSHESPAEEDTMDAKTIADSPVKPDLPETGSAPVTMPDTPVDTLMQETAEDSSSAMKSPDRFSSNENETTIAPAVRSPEVNAEASLVNSLEPRDPSSSLQESCESVVVVNEVVNEPSAKVENNLISNSPVDESVIPVEDQNVVDEKQSHLPNTDGQSVSALHTDSSSECLAAPDPVVAAEPTTMPSVEKDSLPLHLSSERESSEELVEHTVTSSPELAIDEANDSAASELSNVPNEVTEDPTSENKLEHESAPTEPNSIHMPKDEIPKVLDEDLASVGNEIAQCPTSTIVPKDIPEEAGAEPSHNQPENDTVESKKELVTPEVPLKNESIATSEVEVNYEGVVTGQLEGSDEIPSVAVKEESASVVKEPEYDSIPEVPQESEAKQIEHEGIVAEDEKVLTAVAKNEVLITPQVGHELAVTEVHEETKPTPVEPEIPEASEKIPTVASKEETISSDQEVAQYSVQAAVKIEQLEANEIATISTKQDLVAPQFHDNLVAEVTPKVVQKDDGRASVAEAIIEIPQVPVKSEESSVNAAIISTSVTDVIPENLDKLPISTPENNSVSLVASTSPKSLSLVTKEETGSPNVLTSPVDVQNDQVGHVSEVVPSNNRDDALPSTAISEPSNVDMEEKPAMLPDTEKSSSLTQLTFDFDSSAPVAIVLPPSRKPTENSAKRGRGRKRGRQGGEETADSGKENETQPLVLRQSSRIAKLREKEDEERRKQEADRLQRLKEEHERREKRRAARDERMKKMEEKQQRRQQKTTSREEVVSQSFPMFCCILHFVNRLVHSFRLTRAKKNLLAPRRKRKKKKKAVRKKGRSARRRT